ncbi:MULTISPECIES: hypothetical protein [unclassified Streptomyces]|uniref:hypothetical protein n=1 Tax=unclassified Streptomyces TaxID=2593676 RepID=UPI0008238A32|nr:MULTISPECIES: hypothetical protein [unclassified Streptomyces]MYU00444.1 hypothetical protein [Streptomyces sp. SID8350]SCK06976.1 hypothetical protein YUWDRAFT_00163 [Streptomyces sp. AmelKG-D3]
MTEQLDRATGLLREVLGPDLLGACLHGSAVLDALRPASDLDILAITRRSLDPDRRRALLAGLLEISGLTAGSARAREVLARIDRLCAGADGGPAPAPGEPRGPRRGA